ncbi:MAG: hypothetical protein KDC98_09675, partial [Planctomycetes bacterium]|nr:hypothetical protein [Planctomycetota bacterium]
MNHITLAATAGALLAGATVAQVNVSSDITTSTTWTANNVYNLTQQIYVRNGATLTIQAGTVIASQPTANGAGSLAVSRGSQIMVMGTELNPVIMTSTNDTATWTGGNPKTGTWRAAANEWGNLTLMGDAFISEDQNPSTNSPTFAGSNYGTMEGLTAAFPGDDRHLYGGGNDNDSSGTVKYLSLRYGGRVIGANNELNGMSVGGVGRGTTIHHVEIMNNVDDGIETWGGTVNYKNIAIMNVGDDSFDVDQGWRGRAQYVFIVQGYSLLAAQGSGWGDNAFETDGAEQSDYQPRTRATIYNATVVGCPKVAIPILGNKGGTDRGTAWRDGAGVQYNNCIFMDLGEELMVFDNVDGDGGLGYGYNGTRTWDQMWTTAFNNYPNVNAPASPAQYYQSQTSGNLCQFNDCVFYNNNDSDAYNEYNSRTALAGHNNYNNVFATVSPIASLTRSAAVQPVPNEPLQPVATIDPLPRNDALTPVGYASGSDFFDAAKVRGAFKPGNNWATGWTAMDAFGFLTNNGWTDLGEATEGFSGDPLLTATGTLA